jgi:hypothetical protein
MDLMRNGALEPTDPMDPGDFTNLGDLGNLGETLGYFGNLSRYSVYINPYVAVLIFQPLSKGLVDL